MKKSAKNGLVRQEATTAQLILPTIDQIHGELFGLVVDSGLRVLAAMFEADRTRLCGLRYAHDSGRAMTRAGHAPGELAMGGRRVAVKRPRVRTVGGREVELPTWRHLSSEDPLTSRAVEQMLVGVTTRKYSRSLEAVPQAVRTRGTSKSAVSRRFVEATSEHVERVLASELSGLELAVVMIDGMHVDEHVVLVALGIDIHGDKHVLGLHEGATENAVACTSLLANLRDRGLRTERAMLFVLDGSKALRKAVNDVLGARALVQRCQVHKRRNVEDQLPLRMRKQVGSTIAGAYNSPSETHAKKVLTGLAKQLDRSHPSAAASLREGLEETLTVMRLGLTGALLRTLRTTNPIENLNGQIRHRTRNVRRWRGGRMILRWVAASLTDAAQGFRRLRGRAAMPKLIEALRRHELKLAPTIDPDEQAA